MKLGKEYSENIMLLETLLDIQKNYDIVRKELYTNDKRISFFFIDSFVKDDIVERIMEFLLKEDIVNSLNEDISKFEKECIPYIEVNKSDDISELTTFVLSGPLVLIVEGMQEALVLDARTYPMRGVEEPKDDRVIRGSRDGFVETLAFNSALIRRRIRDTHLKIELMQMGSVSKTDLLLVYMDDKVDMNILKILKDKIHTVDVHALTMAQQSLSETLIERRWYDPFPKVKYSERPDVAAASILEGRIILILDNSPSVLILPITFFDFLDEAQDYYCMSIIGTYFKFVRIGIFVMSLFFTPLWYLAIQYIDVLPYSLSFLSVEGDIYVPILLQLLFMEFGIDAIKLASLNTPTSLSSSFSVIGALLLGEFAVKAGWFNGEVIFYMAFVALANFTQSSYEFGYASKYLRMMLLILTACFHIYGFTIGVFFILYLLFSSKDMNGLSYMYPLYPFDAKKLKRVFIREKIHDKN